MLADREPGTQVPKGSRFLIWIVRVTLSALELCYVFAWASGEIATATLIALHLATVLGSGAAVLCCRRNLAGGLLVDIGHLLLTGPLAAAEMLTRGPWRAQPSRIAAGDQAPVASAADALYAEIVAGRRPRRDPALQLSISDRLCRGTLEEKQYAVAVLFRCYRPEMHPMLMAALQSPTPAVRVQAAAVFAKLRERFSAEAKAVLGRALPEGADASSSLPGVAAACRELALSQFLDSAVTEALLALAAACDTRLAGESAGPAAEFKVARVRGSGLAGARRAVFGAVGALFPARAAGGVA